MKFKVRRRYDRGVRIPDKAFANVAPVEGDLATFFIRDDLTGENLHVASLVSFIATNEHALPDLWRVEFIGAAPLSWSLRGLERHPGRRGVHEVYQEWHLEPVNG